jgi:hypothetical protein
MSMMGELNYFLGFQMTQLKDGTFISQTKYTQDLIKRFGMKDANNRQQAIECVSTHVVLRLERHYTPNGIQLRNLSLAIKGLLCRVKHVVECLCSRLWLVIRTSSSVLCLVIVVQHILYPASAS